MLSKGSVCANVCLLTKDKAKKRARQIIKRRKKVNYILLGYLQMGIQMAPEVEEGQLKPYVVLNHQSRTERYSVHEDKRNPQEEKRNSRNPIFKKKIFEEIDIYDELENRSTFDIAVFNDVGLTRCRAGACSPARAPSSLGAPR